MIRAAEQTLPGLRYGSVASGIESASAAWDPLGWEAQFFAQYDPDHKYKNGVLDFPSTVLAHHYPRVPNHGDMTRFKEWPDAILDVLVGGTPCQTFSVAGLGAGLDDPRGNLMLTYVAIARRYRPRWVAWENVPGVLSNDRGRSFASLLACLSGQRIDVPSGGWRTAGVIPGIRDAYGLAWRVLDTQFIRVDGFGRAIPQRRRRVFVVGYLGDYRRAAAVLLEPESMSRNPPPSRRPAEVATPTLAGGARKRGGFSTDDIPLVAETAGTIVSSSAKRGGLPAADDIGSLIPSVANPLTARMFKGVNTTMDEGQTMVPVAFKESHFTRGKDGAPSEVAFPLSADADKGDQDTLICAPDPIAFDCKAGGDTGFSIGEVPGTLRASHDGHAAIAYIPFDTTQVTSPDNRSNPQPGDPCHPLAASAHVPAIAFQDRFRGDDGRGYDRPPPVTEDVCGTLETVKEWNVAAYDMRGREGGAQFEGPHDAANIRAASGGSSRSYAQVGWRVRRLMPVECERLQGFPDGYTNVPWRGKNWTADGPRYKALGNAMSVNTMKWLGMRIAMVDALPMAA